MKAVLKNYRQSPRKVRLIADLVRGKYVDDALVFLSFIDKRAASPVKKLIQSAVSNAKSVGSSDMGKLIIKSIQVDKGFIFKRYRARARGRAAPIRKRTSHISIMLGKKEEKIKKAKPKAEIAEKTTEAKITKTAKPKTKTQTKAVKKKVLPKKLKASAGGGSATGGKK